MADDQGSEQSSDQGTQFSDEWRQSATVTIPVTYTMYEAAVALKRRLSPHHYSRLFEAIVQLEGETYIVEATEATGQTAGLPAHARAEDSGNE